MRLRLDRRRWVDEAEHATLNLDNGAVIVTGPDGSKRAVKIENVHALVLGPGATISHAAIRACSKSGCAVVFTGSSGASVDTTVAPLTSDLALAAAQAAAVSSPSRRLAVVRRMLAKRFGTTAPTWGSSNRLMGWEGAMMRRTYTDLAARYGVTWSGRTVEGKWDELDLPNRLLSSCSPLLYTAAAVTCSAFRLHPDLGIFHAHRPRGFIYDIADIWRIDCLIAPVFAYLSEHGNDASVTDVRHRVKEALEAKFWPAVYNTLNQVLGL